MELTNHTAISEFLLLGLTEDTELQPLIFILLLSLYLVTILGNLLIILAVSSDSHLHTPMYFFLSNLSFTDICISTTTIPKLLVSIHAHEGSITYTGCLTQACFLVIWAGLENCLLAVMAYDRYAAICHPLRYTVIMNPYLCVWLVLFSLVISTAHALLHNLMVLHLSFCANVKMPHFFCELAHVIKLACSDTLINNILVYVVGNIFFGVALCGIILSYIQIVLSVLRISSAGGRYKAFSTCVSHLTVVTLFYGTGFVVYLSSSGNDSSIKNMGVSIMYAAIPQMLNPIIYSLRNEDMKAALRNLIVRFLVCDCILGLGSPQ